MGKEIVSNPKLLMWVFCGARNEVTEQRKVGAADIRSTKDEDTKAV